MQDLDFHYMFNHFSALGFKTESDSRNQMDHLFKLVANSLMKYMNIYDHLLNKCHSNEEYEKKSKAINSLLDEVEKKETKKFYPKALLYCVVLQKHHVNDNNCVLIKWLNKQGLKVEDGTGDSDLHRAVQDMDEMAVAALLEEGVNVNEKNFFGETPLHALIKADDKNIEKYRKIARLLIDHGADWRKANVIDEIPFILAVQNYDVHFVTLILVKITEVDETSLEGNENSKEALEFLCYTIETSKYVVAQDKVKLYEFLCAVVLHYKEVSHRMIYTIDINVFDNLNSFDHETVGQALHCLIWTDQVDIVEMLLESDFRIGHSEDPRLSSFIANDSDARCNITCLLREFKDNWILDELVVAAFISICHIMQLTEVILIVAYHYTINLLLDRVSERIVTTLKNFKLSEAMDEVLAYCNRALLEGWKKKYICEKTIFDVMTMPLDSLVKLLSNEIMLNTCMSYHDMLQSKEKLRSYDYIIKVRLELAIKKRLILDAAKNNLNAALQVFLTPLNLVGLPDEILWKIFAYFNVQELKKLSKMTKFSELSVIS